MIGKFAFSEETMSDEQQESDTALVRKERQRCFALVGSSGTLNTCWKGSFHAVWPEASVASRTRRAGGRISGCIENAHDQLNHQLSLAHSRQDETCGDPPCSPHDQWSNAIRPRSRQLWSGPQGPVLPSHSTSDSSDRQERSLANADTRSTRPSPPPETGE